MTKRALDLTGDSSDSADPSYAPSRRRTRTRSSSAPAEPEALTSTAARFAAASPFLAPRSTAFGGTGTGLENRPAPVSASAAGVGTGKAGKGKGRAKVKGRDVPLDTDAPASPSKQKKRKGALGVAASPDGVLSFAFQNGEAAKASQAEQRKRLEFADGKLLITTFVKEKRGRPRTKGKETGKGRKKRQDSSSEASSSSDDDSDDQSTRIDLDTIIGTDPDKLVVRALVASPRMQVPWTPHRLATTRENKPRESKKTKGKGDMSDDDDRKKKKEKEKTPTYTRNYADKIPLFLLHDEADTSEWKEWTNVVSHRPQGGGMDAKLVVVRSKRCRLGAHKANLVLQMVRIKPPSQRHSLRIAIHTSTMDVNAWKKTENSIWVQDFPQLASAPPASPSLNPTHTPFSSGLLDFLLLFATGVPKTKTAAYKSFTDPFRLFDFSASKDVRLVTSLAGSYDGPDAVDQGGGMTSLAKAIEGLQPREKGKWKVEYLVRRWTFPTFARLLIAADTRTCPPARHTRQRRSLSRSSSTSSRPFAASRPASTRSGRWRARNAPRRRSPARKATSSWSCSRPRRVSKPRARRARLGARSCAGTGTSGRC